MANFKMPNIPMSEILPKIPEIHVPEMPEIRDYSNADYQYEIICENIKEFEDELDDEHEVALKLTSFGQAILLNVTDIGYSNPSIIHFYGYVNGQKSHLIQHVSQLSFLMIATPKAEPEKPPRRIGFSLDAT